MIAFLILFMLWFFSVILSYNQYLNSPVIRHQIKDGIVVVDPSTGQKIRQTFTQEKRAELLLLTILFGLPAIIILIKKPFTTNSIILEGGTYTGKFLDGEPYGDGIWSHPDGSSYEGQWKEGLFDGQGKLKLSDGTVFEGTFIEGKKHGEGTLTLADGTVEEGTWEDDVKI